MGRGKVSHPPRLCTECGEEFIPKNALRDICYKDECVASRSHKYNLAKVAKRQAKRRAEKQGTGEGYTRKCLGCGTPTATEHFCEKCKRKNKTLIAECDEAALGVTTGDIGDLIGRDRHWKRSVRN